MLCFQLCAVEEWILHHDSLCLQIPTTLGWSQSQQVFYSLICHRFAAILMDIFMCPGCLAWAGTICTRAYCHVSWLLCVGRHYLYQSILPCVLAALCGQALSVPEHTAICPGCFVWAGTICTRAYCHAYWGCRRVDCNGCLAKFKGKSWFKDCQIQRLVLVQFTHKNVKMKGIVTKHYKTAKVWPRCL